MRDGDIHIGGVYRIRDWDDMAAEFGLIAGGIYDESIDCKFKFTAGMKPLCGQKFTVKEISYEWSDMYVKSEEGVEKKMLPSWRSIFSWKISPDMLEPWIEEEVVEGVPEDSLFDFIMGSEYGGIDR